MKERIATGLVLSLVTIIALLAFNTYIFITSVFIIVLLMAHEWCQFIKANHPLVKFLYLFLVALLAIISCYMPIFTLIVSLIFWIVMLAILILYSYGFNQWFNVSTRAILGVLALVPFFISLSILRETHLPLLLLTIAVVVIADSSAYFVGKEYGKSPLSVSLSPKKTIEGFIGGFLIAFIFGGFIAIFMSDSVMKFFIYVILLCIIIIMALFGDLFESMMKRQCNIKDSGNILPGHGGLLDRLDSLLPVIPIVLLTAFVFNL